MATAADAELILKLYELRQEPTLRRARAFLTGEFQPRTVHEVQMVQRAVGTDQNAFWRQVTSYWEMAAALVVRGALDADLFIDSNNEGFFLYAKMAPFREEMEKSSGQPFMRHTAKLIETHPAAKARYEMFVTMLAERAAAGAVETQRAQA